MTPETIEHDSTTRVTVRPSDLLEAAIVALESGQYQQCKGALRENGKHCAEGVVTELLVTAYPEHFRWVSGGLLMIRGEVDSATAILGKVHWNRLHPRGWDIQHRASQKLGYFHIVGANDTGGFTFAEIAAALRDARAELEAS